MRVRSAFVNIYLKKREKRDTATAPGSPRKEHTVILKKEYGTKRPVKAESEFIIARASSPGVDIKSKEIILSLPRRQKNVTNSIAAMSTIKIIGTELSPFRLY